MKLKKRLRVKSFRNKWEKLLFNFQLVDANINKHIRDCLRETELTYQQYLTLKIVKDAKGPVNLSYIKSAMIEFDSDISRMVRRLLDLGFVEKSISASDKRHSEIRISESGEEVYADLESRIHNIDEVFFNLNAKEVKKLNELLDKIRET